MQTMVLSVVGGGSVNWMPSLMRDIYLLDCVTGGEIRLIDPNTEHVLAIAAMLETWNHELGRTYTISVHSEFHGALQGSDFVITTFSPGAMDAFLNDLELPIRFGIRQPVSMTVGPCGISAALRTVPVAYDLVQEMEAVCPDAMLLNVTNPMSAVVRGMALAAEKVRFVGLCHEYHGAMARYVGPIIGLPRPEGMHTLEYLYQWLPAQGVKIRVAGLNHFIWLTGLSRDGEDLLPRIRAYADANWGWSNLARDDLQSMDNPYNDCGVVKFALCRHFGCLPLVGDRHLVEFLPGLCNPGNGFGMAYSVFKTTVEHRKLDKQRQLQYTRDIASGAVQGSRTRSNEEMSVLLECALTGGKAHAIVNLPNRGQVSNLPEGTIAETFADVAGGDITPVDSGELPGAIGTLCRLHADVTALTVQAALAGDRALLLEALSLDPLAGVADFTRLGQLADTLLSANRAWLPRFYR